MPKRSRIFRYDPEKDAVVESSRQRTTGLPRYPIYCETLAVHPEQIGEAREYDRANGVATDYREDGTPIMTDSRHYQKYRKLHGYHFKNGYES